jgi:hypothetical protein
MSIQIEILNQKTVTKTSKTGKPFTQLEVAYKNLSFQGKVEGKNIMSFGATAEAFKTLATAQPLEVYDIEIVKNQAGYNDWVSAKKSVAGSSPAQATSSQSSSLGTTAPSTPVRSTYETPEERAKKQIYIVRQSSISSAASLLLAGAKSPPKVADVIDVAKQLEDYVFGANTIIDKPQSLADLEDSEID